MRLRNCLIIPPQFSNLNCLLSQVFFVESICDDPEIIAENIKVRIIALFCFVFFVYVLLFCLGCMFLT